MKKNNLLHVNNTSNKVQIYSGRGCSSGTWQHLDERARYSFLQLHPRFTLERKEASSDFHKFQLFTVQAKSQCLLYSFNRMTEISIFRSPYKSYFGFGIDERQVVRHSMDILLWAKSSHFRSCTWNAFKYQCSLTGFGVNL